MSTDKQVARNPREPTAGCRVIRFPTAFARLHGWMAPVRGRGVAHMAVRHPTSGGRRLSSLCGSAAAGSYERVSRPRRRCRSCLAALDRLKVPAPQPPPSPASPPPGGRAA